MTYADAVRAVAADYKRRKTDYEQAESDAFAAHPDFAANEREKRDLLLRQAKGETADAARLAAVLAQNERLRRTLGLIPPAPRCSKCGDTGRVNGKYCDCVIAKAVQSQAGEIGIPLHDFAAVDYDVYGEKADAFRKIFSQVEKICTDYPANKKRCIVLGGGTGIGKTYLAGCAAQKMLARGACVAALTAFAANNRFLKYHTTFTEEKAAYMDALLDCTFLVIDDLGTESSLKNVTLEYFYQVLNQRNTSGKLTLITTNLTPEKLLIRYGERIYSRLFDKSLAYVQFISAKDLRSAL